MLACLVRTKRAPRRAKRAPPPDGPRWLQDGSESPRRCRRPPGGPRGLEDFPTGEEASQGSPKRQTSYMFFKFLKDFGVVAFSVSRRFKTAQEASKIDPRRHKKPPKEPHSGSPKTAQEAPKTAPRGGPDGGLERTFRALGPERPPGSAKKTPRGPQDAPRKPQEAPKKPPRGTKTAPQRPPRALRIDPKKHPGGL